jgi:hypothetical protein
MTRAIQNLCSDLGAVARAKLSGYQCATNTYCDGTSATLVNALRTLRSVLCVARNHVSPLAYLKTRVSAFEGTR